jgi:hypothetical protein
MKQNLFLRPAMLLAVVLGLSLLSACNFEEPDFSNFGSFKLKELDGKHIEAEFNVDCDNPNAFGFKMKKALIDVRVGDMLIGKINLDEKIKILRKSKNTYTVPLSIDLEDGVLFKLMQLSLKKEVVLKLQGKVRGSVWGIGKSFDIDETRTIDGSQLKLDMGELEN